MRGVEVERGSSPVDATGPLTDGGMADELLRLGAATLHEAQLRAGALAPRVRPLEPWMRIAAPAFTVRCAPGDNLALHVAVAVAPRGSVLVADAGGCLDVGHWGDILTDAAIARGLAGLIIDGAVRDVDAIVALRFPVFASGICMGGPGKDRGGDVGSAMTCAGVSIASGDWLVGDRDGVVAISADRLAATVAAARGRAAREADIRTGLCAGKTTLELLALDPSPVRGHDLHHNRVAEGTHISPGGAP